MSEQVVKLSGVGKHFERSQVTALTSVNLLVTAGQTLAVTGSSGSGKSTLLNIIGTLDHPSAGQVALFGEPVDQIQDIRKLRRDQIGFIFQLHHLLPYLTVRENVLLPLVPSRFSRAERAQRAAQALASVGLAQRADHLPTELSGGERQRTAIARALIADPALVIADEPTGNLDRENSQRLIELLLELVSTGKRTLIVATHDPEVAEAMDRQLVLRDGLACEAEAK